MIENGAQEYTQSLCFDLNMPIYTNAEDLRAAHRRKVPKMFFDYAESGSWSETTLADNRSAFDRLRLKQRVAVDLSHRTLAIQRMGQTWSIPVGIAPTGLAGMQRADGEILAAQAAAAFGVPFILSTMSICSMEDVAAETSAPFWFQLYVMRDRSFVESLIDRAKAVGCSALVLTLDLQILGQRHADVKNGLSVPPRINLSNVLNIALRPAWCLRMLATPHKSFGNIVGHAQGVDNLSSLFAWSAEQLEPALSWDDVAWIKSRWGGPLILKGILCEEDARRATDTGADGLIVSNHGGRQLDGAPATIDVLPEIVRAVGDRMDVYLDGGIRSGQDVFKALALGAKGTFIGKIFLNGLGAEGRAGVTRVLEILERELDLTMAFCGHTDINRVDSSVLWHSET